MSIRSWIRKLSDRPALRPRSRRLEVEALKERTLPAVVNLSVVAVPDPRFFIQGNTTTGVYEGSAVTVTATADAPVVGDQQVTVSGLLTLLYPDLENDRPAADARRVHPQRRRRHHHPRRPGQRLDHFHLDRRRRLSGPPAGHDHCHRRLGRPELG